MKIPTVTTVLVAFLLCLLVLPVQSVLKINKKDGSDLPQGSSSPISPTTISTDDPEPESSEKGVLRRPAKKPIQNQGNWESVETRSSQNNGGAWFQSTDQEFSQCTSVGVSVSGHGQQAVMGLEKVASQGWYEQEPAASPSKRYGQKMVYDSGENLIVLFGGRTVTGQYSSETWIYETATNTWTRKYNSPTPPGRYHHAMAYDSFHSKLVLFSGYWGMEADTWTYDTASNTWTDQQPDLQPLRMYGQSMAYHRTSKKVVLFGGRTDIGGWHVLNETWLYDVARNNWTKMDPPISPPARYGHNMVYDPVLDRIFMFGGSTGVHKNDTWIYDVENNEWTEVQTFSAPTPRSWHSIVYDTEIHRVVLYGSTPNDADIWFLDTTTNIWTERSFVEAPPLRNYGGMAYDTLNSKTVVFGGLPGYKDDTWAYDPEVYSASGTLTSPVVRVPEGHVWDSLTVDKYEFPDTFINISVINAINSLPVPGLENVREYNADISALNDMGISTIRLKATMKGPGYRTPLLHSWNLEWRNDTSWYDGFGGPGKVEGRLDSDLNTSALWRFHEGDGQRADDSSPNGNHGLLGGGENVEPSDPTWVRTRYDHGLRFDGKDDFVWLQKRAPLKPDNALTIEALFSADDLVDKTMTLLDSRANGDYSIQIMRNRTIKASLSTINLGPYEYNQLHSRTTVETGEWYHVALVFDKPDMVLYVNGYPESNLHVDYPIRHSNVPLFIGAEVGSPHYPYDPTNFFHGVVEEIRISAVSRESEEIFKSANGVHFIHGGVAQLAPNVPVPTDDTVLMYHFGDINENIVADSSRNRIPGVISGDPGTVTGKYGSALQLNGFGQYVSVRDSGDMHLQNSTYEFWLRYSDHTEQRIIFSEEKEGASEMNEMGVIDVDGYVHFFLDHDSHDIVSSEKMPLNQWVHLAFVKKSGLASIYINGAESGSGSYSGFDPMNGEPLMIGGDTSGAGSFKGRLDEVAVHGKALSAVEIGFRAREFRERTAFRSKAISLPQWNRAHPGNYWEAFYMECELLNGTGLNISIHDNTTGEPLYHLSVNTSSVSLDLRAVNVLDHPSLFIRASLFSNSSYSPSVLDWGLAWSPLCSPELSEAIPEQLFVKEDAIVGNLTDLSVYFYDMFSVISPPVYTVEHISDNNNISLVFNDSFLGISYLSENWSAAVMVKLNCTNLYGHTAISNLFNIIVVPVDDPPVWEDVPDPIVLQEDESVTIREFFSSHVLDSESSELGFSAECDNENISLTLVDNDTLVVKGRPDYYGQGMINATVYETEAPILNSSIFIPVTIIPVNDPPSVILSSPRNGSVQTYLDVNLTWEVFDPDTPLDNISFDFFLAKSLPAVPYMSDLRKLSVTLDNLEDETTYYWKVVPRDDVAEGYCLNGTWSFTVNTTQQYPQTFLLSPLDGAILNETSVNLSWWSNYPVREGLVFHIYLGPTIAEMNVTGQTERTWFLLHNLTDMTTYHWKVVPQMDALEGLCNSGIWSFGTDTSFQPVYGLELETDVDSVNIVQGENATIRITLENTGNVPMKVSLWTSGIISPYIKLDQEVFLPTGGNFSRTANLTNTRILAANTYELTFVAEYPEGLLRRTVNITIGSITGDGGEDSEKGTMGGVLLWTWILLGAMILFIFILFAVIAKKGRDNEELDRGSGDDLEVLDAEIVSAPLGVRQPTPALGPMEQRGALPQYAGVPGFGPGFQNAPQIPQRAAVVGPEGKGQLQLSQTGAPEPAATGNLTGASPPPVPPPSVPSPSVVLPGLETPHEPSEELKKLPPAPGSGVQVPRVHSPGPAAPRPPPKTPTGESPTSPPNPPAAPGNKYTFTRSAPSATAPKTDDKATEPATPMPGPVVSPPSSSGSILDNLSKMLDDMPSNLPGKENGKQPPSAPPIH